MKGLLIKDWFVIWKQAKWMLLLAILYLVLTATGSSYFFVGFSVLFLSMLPITVMGFDEKSKWNHYAVNMPFSRRDMVKSKYLLAGIAIGTAMVLYFLITSVVGLIKNQPVDYRALLYSLLPMLALGVTFISFNLPVMFKFGVEKGRLWFVLITAILAGGVGALIGVSSDGTGRLVDWVSRLPVGLILLGIVLIFLGSLLLSMRIYEKRDL